MAILQGTDGWPAARYKLMQKSFIPREPFGEHELIDPERDDPYVVWDGKPGPHMQATDEIGAEAIKKAGRQTLNPTSELSLVLGEEQDLRKQLAEAMKLVTFLSMKLQAPEEAFNPPNAEIAADTSAAPVFPKAPPKAPPRRH